MERVKADREKRSRVLLQTILGFMNQGISIGAISSILKESYWTINRHMRHIRKAGLTSRGIRRESSEVDRERSAVVDLRNNGLPYANIAGILNISFDLVAGRISEAVKRGNLQFHHLKGPFESREERLHCIQFFIRLGLTNSQSAYILALDIGSIGNDYAELKKKYANVYRTWGYPLQQFYAAYSILLGCDQLFDDFPTLPSEVQLRLVSVINNVLPNKIVVFLEDDERLPQEHEMTDSYDRVGNDIFNDNKVTWRTKREIWNTTYDQLWNDVRNDLIPLPETLDAFLDLIEKKYEEAVEDYTKTVTPYREKIKAGLAKLSPRNRDIMILHYGLEMGSLISGSALARIYGFTRANFYLIRNNFFAKVRHPKSKSIRIPGSVNPRMLPLSHLALTKQMCALLVKRGISKLGDFERLVTTDLYGIPYIGPRKVQDIKNKLKQFGLKLADS